MTATSTTKSEHLVQVFSLDHFREERRKEGVNFSTRRLNKLVDALLAESNIERCGLLWPTSSEKANPLNGAASPWFSSTRRRQIPGDTMASDTMQSL